MTYVGPGIVHLNIATEIACSYVHYTPTAQSFTLNRPYQGASPAAAISSGPHQEETEQLCLEEDHQGSLHQGKVGQECRRRRKKRKTTATPDRPREQEARERHAAVEGILTEAHLTLRHALTQDNDAALRQVDQAFDNALQPLGQPAPEHTGQVEAAAADEEAERLDLFGLAELKGVLKPKLQLQGQYGDAATNTANLFDQLHQNPRDKEVVAEAYGVPVLLPARCRFLLSDITRLQPLLAGTHVGIGPLLCIQCDSCADACMHLQVLQQKGLTAS